jgi:hypothetical protein
VSPWVDHSRDAGKGAVAYAQHGQRLLGIGLAGHLDKAKAQGQLWCQRGTRRGRSDDLRALCSTHAHGPARLGRVGWPCGQWRRCARARPTVGGVAMSAMRDTHPALGVGVRTSNVARTVSSVVAKARFFTKST